MNAEIKGAAEVTVEQAEREIDDAFAANALKNEGYAQAVWTLLSQTEDAYIKVLHTLPGGEIDIFTDIRMNSLTYPLRVCHRECPPSSKLRDVLIDAHYKLAWDWLTLSDHGYYNFSSIFPLWHRGKVKCAIEGNRLHADAPKDEKAYEAYNRLIQKDAKQERPAILPHDTIAEAVLRKTTIGRDWCTVNFDPRLVAQLVSGLVPFTAVRHSLPEEWAFGGFTLGQYRKVFVTLQAMLWGWMVARNILIERLHGLGYRTSVWVVPKAELSSRLRRYTGLDVGTVERILALMTFGASDIRNPDIAIQPLVDLRNGFFALSPFVWLNTNGERNLCVLLNQLPEQRKIYDRLKNEKETLLKAEMKDFLSVLGVNVRGGVVDGTDLDIAIIDRKSRDCLCLELKWFIEPAEIREINERTAELKGGVQQAKKIRALYERGDERLVRGVLDIEPGYGFMVAVASQNWIGHSEAQDPDVPIVKIWHLLRAIKDRGSLRSAMEWLKNRDYMPKEGTDFEIVPIEIGCGKWTAAWYGIKPLADGLEKQDEK
ncbi:MAG: hypothetical protein WDO56_36580 [Gammaproteobacteria bacterium]